MPYIICNDTYYLSQDKKTARYSLVSDIDRATTWDNSRKANNVCKSLSKGLKKYGLKAQYVTQCKKIINKPAEYIELDCDILEKVNEISEFSKQAEERMLWLSERLHDIELEIVDIEHAAEFYELNAAQGYKIYKMLHDARTKRREIKDELEKIKYFLGTSISSSSMENLKKSIMGLDNRKYTPRINKELFGV